MTDTDSRDLLRLDEQVCYALAVASRSVIALYRPLLEPHGITHPQYLVLLALWEHDAATVGELATRLRLEPATLSPLLKRLESIGYVNRNRRASDERIVEISLTTSGRDLRSEAEKIPERIMQRLQLPQEQLESLRTALHQVIAAAASEAGGIE